MGALGTRRGMWLLLLVGVTIGGGCGAADQVGPQQRPSDCGRTSTGQSGALEVSIDAHDTAVAVVSFSPDCTRLVTAAQDGTLDVWDATTGAPVLALAGHDGWIHAAAFSSDGTLILTSADAEGLCCGQTKIWDATNGQLVSTIEGGTAKFAPDGTTVANSANATVAVWNTMTGALIHDYTGVDSMWIEAISPDTTRALLYDSYDGTTQVLDTLTGDVVCTFDEPLASAPTATFSPDGRQVVTVTEDGRVIAWNAVTGQQATTIADVDGLVAALNVSVSNDGSKVLVLGIGAESAEVRVFDMESGATLLGESSTTLWFAGFSPDGTLVATGSVQGGGQQGVITIRDATTGAVLDTVTDSATGFTAVAFSPDGTRLATGGLDGTATIWTIGTSSPDE